MQSCSNFWSRSHLPCWVMLWCTDLATLTVGSHLWGFSPVPVFPKVSMGRCLYSSFGHCLSLYTTTQFSPKLNFKLQGGSGFQFQFKKHCQNAMQTCSLGVSCSWHILRAWSSSEIKMSLALTVFLHLRDVLCELSNGGHRLARESVEESWARSSAIYI